ncbi:MAG: DUF2336 domain-containing protein [Thermomicrobiales bacterium]
MIDAILRQNEPAVLTALAGNDDRRVSATTISARWWPCRTRSWLSARLCSRHPKLSGDLARALYLWVGQALRQSLVARFELDAAALDEAIAEALREAHGRWPRGWSSTCPAFATTSSATTWSGV